MARQLPQDTKLDILGQLPNLNIYTQVALLYPLSNQEPELHTQIHSTLQTGLNRLAQTFPWTAAKVITLNASSTTTGENHLAPHLDSPTLILKDLTDSKDVASFEEMQAEKFPMEMLPEEIFASIPTIGSSGHDLGKHVPTFAVQCTFIKGGMVLVFVGEHRVMDGIGLGCTIRLFDKACKNEAFTEEEIEYGNMGRSALVPLLDHDIGDEEGELRNQITREKKADVAGQIGAEDGNEKRELKWFSFQFSKGTQGRIKTLATPGGYDGEKEGWISTDDALTAFVFHHITQARQLRLSGSADTSFKLARAVNIRHLFDLPNTYPGMFQSMTYHTYPTASSTNNNITPLQSLTVSLRRALHPSTSTLKDSSQILLSKISQTDDKAIFSLTANFNPKNDFMISSWGKMGIEEVDFGFKNLGEGAGELSAIRRPGFIEVEGLAYLLPKNRDCGVNVVVCLEKGDGEKMMASEEWKDLVSWTA